MYIPNQFKQSNLEEVKLFLEQNSFGILISQVENRPWATHIPFELTTDSVGQTVLMGHLARGNKQWKNFKENEEVLVVFNGPHAYISSSWYDHENVPTWNYIAVHVYGKVKVVEGDALLSSLKKLVNKYEGKSKHPITVEGMSKKFLESELRGIVGFEILVTDIQAAYKLSQNRDSKNKNNIIAELENQGDAESIKLAEHMKSTPDKL